MSLWQSRLGGALAVTAIGAAAVGMSASPTSRATQGECRALNGAQLCVWAETADDTLTTFGATIPTSIPISTPSLPQTSRRSTAPT